MKIQIYNLSRDTNDTDLLKLFTQYGIVNSAEVMRDKLNGRSRCNGVIEMPIEIEANRAILSLDQSLMHGKKIRVSELRLPPHWE